MIQLQNFRYMPGGENEPGAASSPNNNEGIKESNLSSLDVTEGKQDKPVLEKIKEALQQWSNKDEADQEFDDTRV